MKRVILVVCMFFSVATVFGQVKWDVRVGANVSGFSKGNFDMKMGVRTGVGIEYAFGDLFAIRPGIYYSLKGAADAGHKFTMNHRYSYSLSYVELPVLAAFRFKVTDGFALSLNAGPYFAGRIGKKEILGLGEVRRFDAGVNSGLDFLLRSFVVGVEAQYGLTKLAEESDAPHPINYSLMVGYRF